MSRVNLKHDMQISLGQYFTVVQMEMINQSIGKNPRNKYRWMHHPRNKSKFMWEFQRESKILTGKSKIPGNIAGKKRQEAFAGKLLQ